MSAYTDRKELIAKVMQLTELTNDEKSHLVKSLNEEKRYGLVWEEKHEDVETRLAENIPVLQEVKERAIQSDSVDAPNHVLIEGDNLEALMALSYTHKGKIDVIYIDPPYNTGNKDFVYNDSYIDKEDRFFHSKWLSFMHKRLKIANELLVDDGIIFISIDDNEVAQLKVLCDELFSRSSNPDNSNCLGILIWDLGGGTSAGHFTRSHEYILAYCKNRRLLQNFSGGEGIIDDRAIKKKSVKNAESEYFFKKGTKFEAEDGFELTGSWGGTEVTRLVSGKMICKDGMLADDVVLAACWTQRNQMDSFFNGKETYDTKGQRVTEFYFRSNGKLYCRKERSKINPPSILKDIATTKSGTSLLKQIFDGNEPVNYVKPLALLEFLISLKGNSITILDFFAGSGTTLHATMQLNAEDGGKRKCILVTNNENKICEDVTYVRSKKVIEGYTTPKGEKVEGLKKNNLRYYKMDYVPQENISVNMRELMEKATDMLCIKHDIYTEVPLCDKPIRKSVLRYFEEGDKRMLMIYEEEYVEEIVKVLATKPVGTKPIMTYVFSPTNYAYDEDFSDVSDRVELCALPKAIYNSYKHVKDVLKIEKIEADDSEIADESTEEGGEA